MSLPNDTIQKIKLNPNDANTVKDIAPTMMTDSNRSYKVELDTLYEDEKIELKPFVGVLSTDYTIDSNGNFSNLSGRFLNALNDKRDLQLQLPYNNSTADVIFRLEDYYSSSGLTIWIYKSFVTGIDGEQINQVLNISYDSSIPGFEVFNLSNTTLVKDVIVGNISVLNFEGNARIETSGVYAQNNPLVTVDSIPVKDVTLDGTSIVDSNTQVAELEKITDAEVDEICQNVGSQGVSPVLDVKINNVSVVSSNSANLVTNSTYNASTNKIATMQDIADADPFPPYSSSNENYVLSVDSTGSLVWRASYNGEHSNG